MQEDPGVLFYPPPPIHFFMTLDEKRVKFLGELSESFGPSGFERETAAMLKRNVSAYADEVTHDRLGSLICRKEGSSRSPRILLAGHMDEVGFVITGIDRETGFLSFGPLGGWFDQVLLGHRVRIRTSAGDVPGVIASKPPHLLGEEEREKVVKLNRMYIDVGATSGDMVREQFGVKIGDPVSPSAPFYTTMNGRVAVGKAFDDRVGTFVGVEVLRRLKEGTIAHPNTVYLACTVQEEVGLRGAQTVANIVQPDVAIVLEVDIAGDVPGIKADEAPARMGGGTSVLTYDASMIPNQPLKQFVIKTAEDEGLRYQLSTVGRGGTDGGKFHLAGPGCPTIVLSVPARHIHSHSSSVDLEDVDTTVRLVLSVLKKLDVSAAESFVSS